LWYNLLLKLKQKYMAGPGDTNAERRGKRLKPAVGARKTAVHIAAAQRLALRLATSGTSRDTLRDSLELNAGIKKEYYKMGEAVTNTENAKKMRKMEPVALVGSVDDTKFQQVWHNARWYRPYTNAAAQISKLESKLDPSTKKWFKTLKPALDAFVAMGGHSGSDRSLNRKYRSDIRKLVKKHGSDMVYGSRGVLNFLLAFRRVTNIYPKLKNATDADFDTKDLPVDYIKLMVGGGKGVTGGKKDRHAYMLVRKKKPVSKKTPPVKKPKAVEKPVPKKVPPETKKPPVVLKKPDPAVKKAPAFGASEFYKYYEITDSAEFDKELSEFDAWSTDPDYLKIKKPNFWSLDAAETPMRRDVIYQKLFEVGAGSIYELYSTLGSFKFTYPKWFKEGVDAKAKEIQELYFWAAKRMAEYTNDYVPSTITRETNLLQIHESVLDIAILRKSHPKKKMILEQLVKSAKYMEENDPVPASTAKWEKLHVKYKEELDLL
jgi:hypothetical protein